MSLIQIVYWRDIPAQVKAREGRTRVSRPLPTRFQEAIDSAAMRAGASETDSYLAEWRTSEPSERAGPPEAVADEVVLEFEASYPDDRLKKLIENAGKEVDSE
ncbi:MAG: virulence factor [Anaerolineales bacterium]